MGISSYFVKFVFLIFKEYSKNEASICKYQCNNQQYESTKLNLFNWSKIFQSSSIWVYCYKTIRLWIFELSLVYHTKSYPNLSCINLGLN